MVVVASLAALLLTLNGEYQRGVDRASARAAQPAELELSLVNEDRGAQVDGEVVNLGRTYAGQLTSDPGSTWHVVSRGVAEWGLEQGRFQLMVVIPTEFSESLLDLDGADLRPLGLTYQVNGAGDVRAEAAADRRGREVVAELSRQLVDLYVASILGNLQQAQQNVRAVTDAAASHAEVFTGEVDPAGQALGARLDTLADGVLGTGDAHRGSLGHLGALVVDTEASTQDADRHDRTLAGLVEQREQGALTYAQFVGRLLEMDAALLSEQVQHLLDEVARLGTSVRGQVIAGAGAAQHADAVAAVGALQVASATSLRDRLAVLDATDDDTVLTQHAPGIRATAGVPGDGAVTLGDVLAHAQRSGTAPDQVESAFVPLLRQAVEHHVSVLPYRTVPELTAAIEAGTFDHADGMLSHVAEQLAADLGTVHRLWPDHADVPAHEDGVVGADLPEVVAELLAALGEDGPPGCDDAEVCEDGGWILGRDAAGDPGDDAPGEEAPGEDGDEPVDVVAAAVRYGTTVTQVAEAYRRAADLVTTAETCATSCGLPPDVDAGSMVDALVTAAVAHQVADERQHLGGSGTLVEELRAGVEELDGTLRGLQATAEALTGSIDDHLGSVVSLRATMAEVVQDERPAARAAVRADGILSDAVAEARSLISTSSRLLQASQTGVERSELVAELVDALALDLDGARSDAGDRDRRGAELTDLLAGHVAGATEFADTFGSVLPNAFDTGALNEQLVRFLTEPVTAAPRDAVSAADAARLFPWVLSAFTLCVVTGASLAGLVVRTRHRESAFVSGRVARLRRNATAVVAPLVSGTVIGAAVAWAGASDLAVPHGSGASWAAVAVLVCAGLTVLAHWLVRQWGPHGLLAAVVLLVVYVFVSDAVGTKPGAGALGAVTSWNPLLRAEHAFARVLDTATGTTAALAVPLVGFVGAVLLALLVQENGRRLLPRRRRGGSS